MSSVYHLICTIVHSICESKSNKSQLSVKAYIPYVCLEQKFSTTKPIAKNAMRFSICRPKFWFLLNRFHSWLFLFRRIQTLFKIIKTKNPFVTEWEVVAAAAATTTKIVTGNAPISKVIHTHCVVFANKLKKSTQFKCHVHSIYIYV